MKRIAITAAAVLMVLFLVTCGMDQLGEGKDEGIKYTNVVISEDGKRATLFFDGKKVPVSKQAAGRAMTTDLAKMSFDYLEVVFDAGANGLARSAWDLGQSAGISGVYRGPAGGSCNYVWNNAVNDASNGKAALFVGRKNDKALLGVGILTEVTNTVGGVPTIVPGAVITPNTTAITFEIMAVKTGLLAGGEIAGTVIAGNTINEKSFVFTATTATAAELLPLDLIPADYASINAKNSTRSALGNTQYPLYALPNVQGVTTSATYTFSGAAITYSDLIRHRGTQTAVAIERRIPRYLFAGSYRELKKEINTSTKPTLASAYTFADKDAFDNVVGLEFTTRGSGLFSFYLELPVFGLNDGAATNGGPVRYPWIIKTGLGSELYSLDDGATNGGCVLMSIGNEALDWIDIDWVFAP